MFRPDVIGIFEHTVLIIEGKYTEANTFISEWLIKFRMARRELNEVLTRNYPQRNIIVVLALKDIRSIPGPLKTEVQNLHVKIIDEREINYYASLQKVVGIGVGHIFWGRMRANLPNIGIKKPPCLRVKRGKKELYIFSASPHDILCRAFVSHREMHESEKGVIGYQRMLQKNKLNEIAKYIQSGKSFPTPIVVSFTKKAGEVFEPDEIAVGRSPAEDTGIIFGHLRFPSIAGSIQVIDGQHRLFGYSKVKASNEHIIQVVAYKYTADLDPATMFVEINSKQTNVKSGLLWELYPDIYSSDDEFYYLSLISRAVEASTDREIPDRMQFISRGSKGPITFQSLCNEIKKAGFLGKEKGVLQGVSGVQNDSLRQNLETILNALFGAILDLGKSAPNVNEIFILTNNGIIPIIRIIARIIRYEILPTGNYSNLTRRPFLEDIFKKYFQPIYDFYKKKSIQELHELRRRRSSNSGHNQTDDEMTDRIRASFKPNFPSRPGRVPLELINLVQEISMLAEQVNSNAQYSGKISSWVFKEFNSTNFEKKMGRAVESEADLSYFLNVLYQEFIEGSGKDSPDNRICQILCLSKIYDIQNLDGINTLRNHYHHKLTQQDPKKKQRALDLIKDYSGLSSYCNPNDLESIHYQKIAVHILNKLKSELLEKLIEKLKS